MTSLHVLFLMSRLSAPAMAGYGDVDADGLPSWEERDLHVWTNVVRVEPEAWDDQYRAGGCSFDSFLAGEKVHLPPLGYDRNLNDAGRYHSQDMVDNNHFAHESSDGTSFQDRIARYYDVPFAGENIAYGYPDGFTTVMQGWMCSSGHRANIMLDGYTELGTGVVGTYYTQDFGGGERDWPHPVQMGNHEQKSATHDATFRADWYAADGPASFDVVVDGIAFPLALEYGEAQMGIYAADVAPEATSCHQYYFHWEESDGTTAVFPEEGSYTYGESCDSAFGWVAGHLGLDGGGSGGGDGTGGANGQDEEGNPLTAGVPKLVGCTTSGRSAPWAIGFSWVIGLALVSRRSRSRAH